MRLSQLEDWLLDMGWEPEPNKPGSHRHWTHALYPGQRLSYGAPHGTRKLPSWLVIEIYRDLIAMKTADELEQVSA